MRFVLLLMLVSCGGGGAKSASPKPDDTTQAAALPPPPSCEPRMEVPDGFHDRYAFSEGPEDSQKYGFKTKAGKVVIPATFHHAYPFTPGGVAAVIASPGFAGARSAAAGGAESIDGTTPFVFIDTSGKVLGKAYPYDNGPDYYQEGFARIVGPDGKIGYISETTGRIEIAMQFDQASSFCEGKADVEVAGAKYAIDKQGKRLP